MPKAIKIAVATGVAAVLAGSALSFYLTRPRADALGEILQGYGFLPITPPSNLINVGSLYYVDPSVTEFKAICRAEKTDLDGAVIDSRSWELKEDLQRNGRFAAQIEADIGGSLRGGTSNRYAQSDHTSLTDVVIEEIPLGASLLIFDKLMGKPECNKVATQVVNAGGYVCQGQKVLRATVAYAIDLDTQNEQAVETRAAPGDIKGNSAQGARAGSDGGIVERQGRSFAGATLEYGVSMNPTCLAPQDGRFERILPHNMFDRAVNFVLFRIVEPIWPAKSDAPVLAQNTPARQ